MSYHIGNTGTIRVCQTLREAQEGNLEIVKIKEQLANLTKAPPPVRLIYELHDGLVVVPEPDGRKRVVVAATENL